jgi:hypothetical protein
MKREKITMTNQELKSVFLRTLANLIEVGHLSKNEYVTAESLAMKFMDDLEKYEKKKEKERALKVIADLVNEHFPDSFQRLLEDIRK